MKPSIEAAAKMAQILDVGGIHKKRIQQVTKMSEKDREHVFAMLDAFIKQTMSQSVLQ
jgi:hypothetical protein